MKFILITASLVCSLSWISASGSHSQTVEVQAGEGVTLTCSNVSTHDGLTFWFRLDQSLKPTCISTRANSGGVKFCDGFNEENFEMKTNLSTVSLTIKHVNSSDSGLYFCGFYNGGTHSFSVTRLNVSESKEEYDYWEYYDVENLFYGGGEPHENVENKCEGTKKLMSGILCGFIVVLFNIIIGLAVKVRKLQTAASEQQDQQDYENDCNVLEDAALTTLRNRRSASEREVETHVVYTARN